ncbi:hypothetical protein HER21_47215, partial [Pseudomonas sp. BGM005]|nr:hypothetical protein [Pseudomonas sp. BG5]
FMLFDRRQIGWVTLAFGMIIVSVMAIEAVWGGGVNYLLDIRLAGKNSGGFPTMTAIGHVVRSNFVDLLAYLAVAVILLILTPTYR